MAEAIAVKNINKSFPGVKANRDICFAVKEGEIRAVVGENGAGKTTLMNMLYGLIQPDSGQIFIKGKEVKIPHARAAIAMGIGMVHQHFKLVPSYTLAQNIVLGIEPTRALLVDDKKVKISVREISERYGLAVDTDKLAGNASVGEQQRAEILKALYRGADILILDEPTAVLTDHEADDLFVMLKNLTAQGKTILFISHKLREVFAVSDNTSVMRAGKLIGTLKTSETDSCQLAELMVGREMVGGRMRVENPQSGKSVLDIKSIDVIDERNLTVIDQLSLSLLSGEVLGIAGVDGNGQEELTDAIMGLKPVSSGQIFVNGNEITNKPTRLIRESGVAYIPSDRYKSGAAVDATVWENMVADDYYCKPICTGINLNFKLINQRGDDLIKRYQVVTPSLTTRTGHLSGGNIQKLIVGRELGSEKASVVIASQPTRGIDIAGTEAIRKILLEYTHRGAGVLLISADLDEILALSDRVMVLYEGKLFNAGVVDDEIRSRVGNLMTGVEEKCPS